MEGCFLTTCLVVTGAHLLPSALLAVESLPLPACHLQEWGKQTNRLRSDLSHLEAVTAPAGKQDLS